jgi:hypothetical protein
VRRRMERNEGDEGEREAVRKRMERKSEKGSEEDDYFNKFPPTMPSVVLENRSCHPPHYRSPSFLSILLTTSLPHSYPSSSLPLSLLLSHPHYLSPSFLSVILTTSPSCIPFNPPPHYLSSLSCNIIIHLITSVFLPSPSSLFNSS